VRTKKGVWAGRKSSGSKLYFYQWVKEIDHVSSILPGDIVLVGYPYDEGVRRNQGRPGSKYAPESIKSALAKTAFQNRILDLGDIHADDEVIESGQKVLSEITMQVIRKGALPINIGGGHDIAFASGSGAMNYAMDQHLTLGIINFDAHFDLRKPIDEGNSGTPFYQLSQLAQSRNLKFLYTVLGIQKQANSHDLFQTADHLHVKYLMDDKMAEESVKDFIADLASRVDKLYVSIDLDVLNSSYAPGVSAINPFGISPNLLLFALTELMETGKVCAVDIAEMNPTCDVDGRTAKLAAYLINHICDLFLSFRHES
jgi:formiminoglutamase